ncbi:phospholipid:lipid A palmitoyltransferase [Pantoea sp. Aalb]|nr:phospholipid:lipid A palmitoyltransferase [Pantoea sp. Aalb]
MNNIMQLSFNDFNKNILETWLYPQNYDFYLPIIIRHNRWMYDDHHIKRYNENPWGLGGDISRLDDKGNWHSLYMIIFKDSFNKWEISSGYNWEMTWHPFKNKDIYVGAGYTVGITLRDNWRYIPIPLVLPLASIGYKLTRFQMTYIPGVYNNGNVYFACLNFQF